MNCSICGKPIDFYYAVGSLSVCDNCATRTIEDLAGAGFLDIISNAVEVSGEVVENSDLNTVCVVDSDHYCGWLKKNIVPSEMGECGDCANCPHLDNYSEVEEKENVDA